MSETEATVELYTKSLGEIFCVNLMDEKKEFDPLYLPLAIPEYQRSFEWTSYHVKNLLNDTYNASQKKSSYRMGTIILHNTNGQLAIVDGQQRLIVLTILLNCLPLNLPDDKLLPLLDSKFDNIKSFYYIKNTKKEVESFLSSKQDALKKIYLNFLLTKLTFSVLTISGENALDQAYTFFDGLNSKGKGLNDFDLLKAHHLMFIPEEEESLARIHNDYWQKNDQKHGMLFSSILRRIRMWSRGKERDDKSDRNDFYEFISAVEPNEIEQSEHLFNRYMQPNVFRSWHRENDEVVLNMKYPQHNMESLLPMEIPQTIEGGDAFFLYAKRYHEMFDTLFGSSEKKSSPIDYAYELAKSINNEYLSMAFKAVVLLYYDKFGEQRLIEVATCTELIISKIRFVWGKERPSPVRIEGTLSRVKDKNLVPIVLNSTISSHVVTQLNAIITTLPRDYKITRNNGKESESPTIKNYKEGLTIFYYKNKSKIKNLQILEKINTIYNLNKNN